MEPILCARRAGVLAFGLLFGSPVVAVGQDTSQTQTTGSYAALTGNGGSERARLRDRKALIEWPGPGEVTETEEGRGRLASDRPDFTEASTTVGKGVFQLEVGHTYFRDRSGNTRTQTHSYPEALLRIGMFADWFEFRIQQNVFTESVRDNGTNATRTGAADTYLGVKLAVAEQKGVFPELAVMPQGTVPTGDRAFTADEVLYGLNVLYGWDVTDGLTIAGSTQANKQFDEVGRSYALLATSVTVGYTLTDNLNAFTEYFVFMPVGGRNTGGGAQHFVDGGFQFFVTDDLAFDIRAGYGISRSAPDFFAGTGFVVRY